MTSWRPLVVCVHEHGLARFATDQYHPDAQAGGAEAASDDLGRTHAHLTNSSLNRHSGRFVPNADAARDGSGSKWSTAAYWRRLRSERGDDAVSAAQRAVDDLVAKTAIAVEPAMSAAARAHAGGGEELRERGAFQIFGFDVLLDAELRPWLLEVYPY